MLILLATIYVLLSVVIVLLVGAMTDMDKNFMFTAGIFLSILPVAGILGLQLLLSSLWLTYKSELSDTQSMWGVAKQLLLPKKEGDHLS
ncbi:MAG: hypothetical protein COT91_03290 [Candidatus Doudnabacteria bacterium CG10_big_fil_rev_8_21_14_0_10_41_10]|uniref:Uncharacterized protein n=1 Tax=Candidatus Doudnabacteria bacterium CG10_big_fil_rev_8_21_14_0_10_41_10 TaxID=1974551 RepID=A0A2H0VFN5_9BACT|nr:MAG: hypothetical protein COT91_03290 [Candidatus Doudnabacteria bacterium CG10_big_fil_rev_8_21_14_0_10_41_10]